MMMNRILEIVNNVATINRWAAALYVMNFLFFTLIKPRPQAGTLPDIVIPDIYRHAICISFALLIFMSGGNVVGTTIAIFRAWGIGGGAGVPTWESTILMSAGQLMMAAGLLLLIRILSYSRFKNRLCYAVAALDGAYLIVSVL